MTGETWFEFTAFNSQAHYGYGLEQEADVYCDILNRKRNINMYSYQALSAEDASGLDSGDDTDGFRLDEAISTQAENDEWQTDQQA